MRKKRSIAGRTVETAAVAWMRDETESETYQGFA